MKKSAIVIGLGLDSVVSVRADAKLVSNCYITKYL